MARIDRRVAEAAKVDALDRRAVDIDELDTQRVVALATARAAGRLGGSRRVELERVRARR